MNKHLAKYFNWKELEIIAKALNGGPLGLSPKMSVNPLTAKKADLAIYIDNRWTVDDINENIIDLGWASKTFTRTTPATTPEQDQEEAWDKGEPEEAADGGSDEAEKYRKIKEILGGTEISEEKVKQMIDDAIADRPIKTVKIIIKDNVERQVKGIPHKMIDVACRKVSANINTMLFGAPGCGKTVLAKQTAEALGLPFAYISCNGSTTPEDIFGRLIPGNNGEFIWKDSPLMPLVENGGLFLWDELDALPYDILFACQMLLSEGRLVIPARIHQPELIAHKDFRAMATCNSLGNGGGAGLQREVQDSAAFDRWKAGRIKCEYDLDLERQISEPAVYAWAVEIREKIVTNNLRHLMTTRNMVDFSKDAMAGATRKDWDESYFMDWNRDELSKVGRKAAA